MKHTKPTMSWATDQNHLNELLAKYWEREYNELRAEADASRKMIIDHDTKIWAEMSILDRAIEELGDCLADKEATDEMGIDYDALVQAKKDFEEGWRSARRERGNV